MTILDQSILQFAERHPEARCKTIVHRVKCADVIAALRKIIDEDAADNCAEECARIAQADVARGV